MEIVQAARIDGAGEFRIFNTIVLPVMEAGGSYRLYSVSLIAGTTYLHHLNFLQIVRNTQCLLWSASFVEIFIKECEYGSVYMGLTLTVLPLIVMYLILSKYIIAGVALGGVKSR